MTPHHTKVLYVLVALLFCIVVALFWYLVQTPKQFLQSRAPSGGGSQLDAATAEEAAKVVVGSNTDTPAAKILGTITQIDGSSMLLKESASGAVYTASISQATRVVVFGARKDPSVYQKELDAYYAQVKELVQDPIKNKDALAALMIPSDYESKQGNISDLKAGDAVEARAESSISGQSFVAVLVVRLPTRAQ